MTRTHLIENLASQIVAHIQSKALQPGTKLPERKLAEVLRVSRSPVRGALMLLEQSNIVMPAEGGGFAVSFSDRAGQASPAPPVNQDDKVYFKIADDRLEGRLPTRISENELARRYGLTRSQLVRITRRIANEGWIERLPGHGWVFGPILDSLQAYKDSYRFRIIIEPSAIMEPSFVLNVASLTECLHQQEWLLAGGIQEVTPASLYEMNSKVHEKIAECSQNMFFIDALKRIDHLRRLIEYRQSLNFDKALVAIGDHITLIKLLLDGKRQEASDFLREHLRGVAEVKTKLKPS